MADDLEDLETPGPGHNSDGADEAVSVTELRQLIERIERLEEEKKSIGVDIREVYAEAKGRGFDTKAMRAVVRYRAMDKAKREEERATTEMYLDSLGLL